MLTISGEKFSTQPTFSNCTFARLFTLHNFILWCLIQNDFKHSFQKSNLFRVSLSQESNNFLWWSFDIFFTSCESIDIITWTSAGPCEQIRYIFVIVGANQARVTTLSCSKQIIELIVKMGKTQKNLYYPTICPGQCSISEAEFFMLHSSLNMLFCLEFDVHFELIYEYFDTGMYDLQFVLTFNDITSIS